MWTMFITLFFIGHNPALTTAGGFNSRQSCVEAATAYRWTVDDIYRNHPEAWSGYGSEPVISITCVKN